MRKDGGSAPAHTDNAGLVKVSLPTEQGLELDDLEGPFHPKRFHDSVKMLLSEPLAEIFTCHFTFLPLEGIVSLGMDGSEGTLYEVS